MKDKFGSLIVRWLVGIYLALAGVAGAQNLPLTTLVNFDTTNGAYPQAGLALGTDGQFYGAAYSGGTNNSGTVFKVTASGNFTSLFSFATGAYNASFVFTNANGAVPYGQLVQAADHNFYGTTSSGTPNGRGSIFKITTNGGFTSLCNFDGTNGAVPEGALLSLSDGLFYGTTFNGGTNNSGTVFKVTTNGILTVLQNFNKTNGLAPFSGLTLGRDGLLYGTTELGGTNNSGTVFKISTNGLFTSFFSFNTNVSNGSGAYTNATGASPLGGLTLGNDGYFYGTARLGGQYGYGVVFKLSTNGTLTPLVHFNNTNGANPEASLVPGNDGNFYGTTYGGGTNGAGTVFRVTTNGTLTTLFTFSPTTWSGHAYTNATGAYLESPLTFGTDGNLYGTTLDGGSGGFGTVFKLSVATTLNIQLLAGKAVLNWANPAFNLQSALEATGTYSALTGAVSPYTNVPSGNRRFFRLSNP